ncbi:hypothetical protein NPIL_309021 [Nephila pilipes]|uniref:Uncharacterized protein n=1 Tax=Nephila pilipes TaxID=299642 RepID=A0A8X6PEY8_NEPPI|nr:hypothetical protein NPIL_309021 [Nephila pilipes]
MPHRVVVREKKVASKELLEVGLPWDETLPPKLKSKFEEWCQEIRDLKELKLPRPYFAHQILTSMEIHIYCDTSQRA